MATHTAISCAGEFEPPGDLSGGLPWVAGGFAGDSTATGAQCAEIGGAVVIGFFSENSQFLSFYTTADCVGIHIYIPETFIDIMFIYESIMTHFPHIAKKV